MRQRLRHGVSMDDLGITYGIHPVEELLRSNLGSVDHVYFDKDRKNAHLFELMKVCRKERLAYNLVPELKLRQITGSANHQGIAALRSALPYASTEALLGMLAEKNDPLVILPASVEDPGNLGAIVRSAVALGADALLLERKNSAPLGGAAAKSSAGMIEHIPIGRPKNLEAFIGELAQKGFRIIGAEMTGGDPPWSVRFAGPTVLILGGEHRGIPPYLRKQCTGFVSIPMDARAQSLNVSATAAILLYEAARQRADVSGP
jgi:23S rRNA (guanosine2251-2'-O)-methyltransferase